MAFLNPLALLAVGLIGPLIVLLHLLRRRRTPQPVSSTYLWRQVIRDVTADAPWQRLRRNLLFILQFLAVVMLALTLAGPFRWSNGSSAQHLIIVVDLSASMAARHAGSSRLNSAIITAQRIVAQLPTAARVTVIAAGSRVSVPVSYSSDHTLVQQQLQALQVDFAAAGDLGPAVSLAAALADQQPASELLLLSDGAADFGPSRSVAAPLRFVAVGENVENTAIGATTLEASAVGRLFTFQAVHYGADEQIRRVTLTVDNQLVDAFDLQLRPGVPQTISRELPADIRRVEVAFAETDAFPYDDVGRAAAGESAAAAVNLVADDNRYLATLLSLLPGIRLTSSAAAADQPAALTVYDGTVPQQLPAGNLLFINPPSNSEFFSVIGRSQAPRIRTIRADSSLLRGVTLNQLTITQSRVLQLPEWADTLIEGDSGPLLAVGENLGRRIAVLAFDLRDSNLPLQVDFPILFSQLISYLAPLTAVDRLTWNTDETPAWQADPSFLGRTAARAQPPAGGEAAPGWYEATFRAADGSRRNVTYAVNLPLSRESQLEVVAAPQLPLPVSGSLPGSARSREDFSQLPALLVLVILLLEWFAFFWDRPKRDGLTQTSQN
jgi:Ca-activated chloride channel homolog